MIGFSSLTGTRSTIEMLRSSGWGVLVTPDTGRRTLPGCIRIAMDNGAWGAHVGKREWNKDLFMKVAWSVGPRADWCVVPDVVGDAEASWKRTLEWMDWCLTVFQKVLIAVQDGMEAWESLPFSGRVGIFVGGSTEWKLRTLDHWGREAKRCGAWLHVGRVNSAKRIASCAAVGADSFDGNSSVLFPCTHKRLEEARAQSVAQGRLF